jgi:hypothetical protein
MLTIDAAAWLDLPREFTDEELTYLIAEVIDELDPAVLDPSVGTTRMGQQTQVRVFDELRHRRPVGCSAAGADGAARHI